MKSRRNRTRHVHHSGMATVELAVCLPLLVLVIFGSIEACNMIFLKQSLTEAAHQGALSAMKKSAVETDVTSRIQAILDARNITASTIVIADGNFAALNTGDVFTVRVSTDADANRISPTIMSSWRSIEAVVTTAKQ